jgi:4'-phosphopantetheinyl transferase EntD
VSNQSQFSCHPADGLDAVHSLFPPGVAVAVRREPGDPADLLPGEAVYVAKAVPKRINEFAAGRACARRALATFGMPGAVLLAAPDRQPLWPTGFVGSITHTAGFCAAAVAPRGKFSALGLDSEQSGAPTADLWPTLCRPEELDWVDSLPPDERPAAVTLIFSSKEAVYKCQYPVTGEWLDFHDLQIDVLDWGSGRGRFVVRPTRPIKIAAALPEGRYSFHEQFISTALCIPA